jgi:poly(hydroxyalkanoate) granule-associated protein
MAEAKNDGVLRNRLHAVQTTFNRVQKEGERVVGRLRKDAGDLLGKDRKKAVQELLSQAQKLRNDIQKRAERALKDLEERTQQLISAIEKQAGKGVEPILRSLNLASRDEVDKLKKRLNQIEKRLEEVAASKAA